MSVGLRIGAMVTIGILAIACAPPRVAVTGSTETALAPRSELITGLELSQVGRGQSLISALQQARPSFLLRRGVAPLVSIDGSPPTTLSTLRLIPVTEVHEVRLVRAAVVAGLTGVLPNGDMVTGDVLLVITRVR